MKGSLLIVVVWLLMPVACGAPAASPTVTVLTPAPTLAATATNPAMTPNSSATPTTAPSATRIPATAAPTARTTNFAELKPKIDAIMSAYMQADKVVGCSLAAVYPEPGTGKLQAHFANYGALAKGSKTAVDATTEFEIGSLTKLFTADLLALFVRDGLMRLDDPLQKYLPASVHVPAFNGQSITLRELATHTSGLPRRADNVPQFRAVNGVLTWGYATADEIYAFLNAYKLTRAPGTQWEYSNLAFALLGMAEEKVGGATYENLVLTKIAAPLGLADTRMALSAAEKARLAQGYAANGEAAPPVAVSGATLAAGALRSTAQDLGAYLAANIDPSATKLDTVLSLTLQPQAKGPGPTSAAGLGWNIAMPGSVREVFSKDGATAGYNAYIAFSRFNRAGFALACDGQNLAKDAASPLLKLFGDFDALSDDNE